MVVDYDSVAGSGPGLYINIDVERTRVINHVGTLSCGGYTAGESNHAVVLQRLTESAPIGAAVRVVRSMPLMPGECVYISERAATTAASATEAASTTTTTSTTATSPATTTTQTASATTTTAPSTANASTATEILLSHIRNYRQMGCSGFR